MPAARTATATVVAGQNRVRLSRARARWLRGDNATALTELNDALTLVPGLPEALNLRALVRIASGDVQGAADDADRAFNAQPSNLGYRDARAYAWLKLGRHDAAASEYDGILAGLRPENRASGLLGRGIARAALGRVDGARADLEMGLRLLPDSEPDPQLADLEIAARRALEQLPPSPASPSPAASPAAPGVSAPAGSPAPSPAVTETPAPVASPAASPIVLRPTFPVREPPP
jgi:tetratricopeptide (TPR) repeat protein